MLWSKVAVQIFSVISGVLAVFLVPLVYGIEQYGAFLKTSLLSFVIHRLIDVANEPLLATEKESNILVVCLFNGMCMTVGIVIVCHIFDLTGLDIPLLVSMMVSSAYVSYLYKKNDFDLLKYYFVYIPVFLLLLIAKPVSNISFLFQIVAWGAIISSFIFGGIWRTSSFSTPKISDIFRSLFDLPKLVLFSFSNILITYLYIYLLMGTLTDQELGSLRYVLSLVQASVLLYPISMKHILKEFSEYGEKKIKDHMVFGYFIFLNIGLLMLFLNYWLGAHFEYRLPLDIDNLYVFIAFSPVLFVSYLVERLHASKGHISTVGVVSVVTYLPLTILTQSLEDLPWMKYLFFFLFIYAFTLLFIVERNVAIIFMILSSVMSLFYFSHQILLLIFLEILLLIFLAVRRIKWCHG